MRRGAGLGVLVVLACGPEPLVPAELAEVCGQEEPFRLLALEPGQALFWRPQIFGDRAYFQIVPDDDYEHTFVRSTGMCGEDLVALDPTVRRVFTRDRWPGLVLGTRTDGDIVLVDPQGVEPSHVVFAGVGAGSYVRWTDVGIVVTEHREDAWGAAFFYPYPADPRAETVQRAPLYDPVPITGQAGEVYSIHFELLGDDLLMVSAEGHLVRVAVPDGSVAIEQPGVREFALSSDQRYLLWQANHVVNDDSWDPRDDIFLRDLQDGHDTFLTVGNLWGFTDAYGATEPRRILVNNGPNADGRVRQRLYAMSTLEYADLPEDYWFHATVPDGRWLISTSTQGAPVDLFDPKDGGVRHLIGMNRGLYKHILADGIEVLDVTEYQGSQGPLYFVPFDGSPPRTLADEITSDSVRLDDGRYVSIIDIGGGGLGEFVLLDTGDRTATSIDDRVNARWGVSSSPEFGANAFVYSVNDGDRSGIWVARIPER